MANKKPKDQQEQDILNAALSEVPAPVISPATLSTDAEQAAPIEAPKEEPKAAAPAPVRTEAPKPEAKAPEKEKIRCTFQNWRMAQVGPDRHVFGNVEGHPGFAKGEPARSSAIVLYSEKDKFVVTEGELITLGKPASK